MKKPVIFVFGIVMTFSMFLFAGKQDAACETYLVTAFDFARYPACTPDRRASCIVAIRFYDADSDQRLAEVPVIGMSGAHRITATAKAGTSPRRAYAVTVYVDSAQQRKEGPRGGTSGSPVRIAAN